VYIVQARPNANGRRRQPNAFMPLYCDPKANADDAERYAK
jgi:hypothetical protein